MDFENIIKRMNMAIEEENQKKIDVLCNLYLTSSFTISLQEQIENIEKCIVKIKENCKLSKVSMTMVKIAILGKMIEMSK